MDNILISYDIEDVEGVHVFVKNHMMTKMQYHDSYIFINSKLEKSIVYLPNTTLWKPFTTSEQARADLKTALNQFKKDGSKLLEKAFCTKISDYVSYNRYIQKATVEQIKKIPMLSWRK